MDDLCAPKTWFPALLSPIAHNSLCRCCACLGKVGPVFPVFCPLLAVFSGETPELVSVVFPFCPASLSSAPFFECRTRHCLSPLPAASCRPLPLSVPTAVLSSNFPRSLQFVPSVPLVDQFPNGPRASGLPHVKTSRVQFLFKPPLMRGPLFYMLSWPQGPVDAPPPWGHQV